MKKNNWTTIGQPNFEFSDNHLSTGVCVLSDNQTLNFSTLYKYYYYLVEKNVLQRALTMRGK